MKAKTYLGALIIGSLASVAVAQSGNSLAVPPMPKELDLLGDPDAACVMGTVDSYSRVSAGTKDQAEEKRNELLEIPMRQLAFFAGKLTARMGDSKSQLGVNASSKIYTDQDKISDTTAIVTWCFRSYLEVIRTTFNPRIKAAEALNKGLKVDELALIDPESVPHDARCFALVTNALPATKEAAKTNPKAQRGVNDLARTQHFYIGRMSVNPDNAAVEGQLAKAFLYSAQLQAKRDEPTSRKYGMACIKEYQESATGIVMAAKSDWKPSKPG